VKATQSPRLESTKSSALLQRSPDKMDLPSIVQQLVKKRRIVLASQLLGSKFVGSYLAQSAGVKPTTIIDNYSASKMKSPTSSPIAITNAHTTSPVPSSPVLPTAGEVQILPSAEASSSPSHNFVPTSVLDRQSASPLRSDSPMEDDVQMDILKVF
jgi:hypothetical protein